MAEIKITNAMVLEAAQEMVANAESVMVGEVEVTSADVIAYCVKVIEQNANKAAKAKERAAAKKAEDALLPLVEAAVTDEFQFCEQITANVDAEDVTVAKVRNRLGKLIEAGVVVKADQKDGSRKRVAYKRA